MFNIPSFFGFKAGGEPPVPLLLDLYPNAAAAYSLRGLSTPYVKGANPYACQVRNSSNVPLNIGFVFNPLTGDYELDTAALLAHCAGGNGFVTTWYDQSGNAQNATQILAINQPQIVSSGSVITLNSNPGVDFQLNQFLTFAITWSRPTWIFSVHEVVNTANAYAYDGTITDRALLRTLDTVGTHRVNNGLVLDESSSPGIGQKLMTVVLNSTNSFIYNNGLQTASGNAGTANPTIMTIGAAFDGFVNTLAPHQEFILYQSDQSSNRTGIETNINDFYSIY
jgi:hypothetical protein